MYNELALRILMRAVNDYKLLKELECTKLTVEDENVISLVELERFFRSEWCDFLLSSISKLSGRDILKMLQE